MGQSKKLFSRYSNGELRELYETDPELFDELAEDAIQRACIGKTPGQTLKRRQLQWTIDTQLRKAKTPLERMHIMESIFYNKIYGGEGQLAQLMSSCTEFIRTVRGDLPTVRKPELYLVKKERRLA
jgi:hypothetical protein